MEIENFKLRLLLSAQRALLGEIYPEIRAITVGFRNRQLQIIYYLNRVPIEIDFESIGIVSSQIFSDFSFDFDSVDEECKYYQNSLTELRDSNFLVYMRKE